MKNLFLLTFSALFFCVQPAIAQSGGPYEVTEFVIATGAKSSGGTFSIENTNGQPLAGGFIQSPPYSLYMGFWTPSTLAPTASSVTIGGRVITSNGQGVRNVIISLTDSGGTVRTVQTTTFGYYRFTDVRAGEIYILTISSKRFTFSKPTRILNVDDELTGIDFIADE